MKGVLLVNLGSPESPTAKDVKPYLDEFLMDKYVIDVPFLLRSLLVRGIILQTYDPDLSGFGDFGYTSGLITNETNPNSMIIRKNPNKAGLEKIKFLGYGGILGEQVKQITPLNY